MAEPPDNSKGRTSIAGSYWFVIRISGADDYACKAVGPQNSDSTVGQVTHKAPAFANDDLRQFTLRFAPDQKQTDIQLGLAVGDWKAIEQWPLPPRSTPYDMIFSSTEPVILRCPEQKDADVVAEVTQAITERAARLVLFDRDGHRYGSQGEEAGQGGGIVRYIHRFKNLDISTIAHIEFQTRPYDYWITFSNVSLQPGHRTQVKVEVKRPGYLLVGSAIPKFDGIKTGFPAEDLTNRVLLICFCDINQRPSRNCIVQLAKQASQLKEKGVTIVAVQATIMDENALNEWVKQNNIPFPVGMIQADEEKIRLTWGVRSLPWLILTDRQHIVTAEGFTINELDEKIMTLRKNKESLNLLENKR